MSMFSYSYSRPFVLELPVCVDLDGSVIREAEFWISTDGSSTEGQLISIDGWYHANVDGFGPLWPTRDMFWFVTEMQSWDF